MSPRNKKRGRFGLILGHAAELEEVLDLWKQNLDVDGHPIDPF
jgi:hypothetical protein